MKKAHEINARDDLGASPAKSAHFFTEKSPIIEEIVKMR